MDSKRTSLEQITGMISVGSLCLLGLFLFLDGRTDVYNIVDTYGKSVAWGIVAALPTLVIAYVCGVVAVTTASSIFKRAPWQREVNSELITIATFNNSVITTKYLEISAHRQLLEGCTIGFAVVAFGAWSDAMRMTAFRSTGLAIAFGALFLAILCPVISAVLAKEEQFLVTEVDRLLKQTADNSEGKTQNAHP